MLLWVILIVLLGYFYFFVKKKQSFWEEVGIVHIKPKFLLGNLEIIKSKSFGEKLLENYLKFPNNRYYGYYQFLQPTLIIKDPNLIKLITVKEFDHFVDHRTFVSNKVDPIWGKNLFASQGERWRDLRSTLSPSFTSSKMKIMYELIDKCAQQFVEYFKNDPATISKINVKDTLSRYTNDVIASTAFGLKYDSLTNKNNEFYMMGKEASNFGGLRMLRFFISALSPTLSELLKVKIISTKIGNYFSNIIKETVKVREEKHIVRPDMIHLLLEAKKGREHHEIVDSKIDEGFATVSESEIFKNRKKQEITIDDIIAQAFIFFLAGFESVSTLITFAFYEIAVNSEIQDKLRQEIQSISGTITYEKLLKMKYLDMVTSETLRKWPAAIFTDRKVTKAFTIQPELPEEKPVNLEEGMICWLPIYAIHNDPKYYPNPEKFDPERFSDENKHNINPFTYLPFGSGPRNCIGSRFALLETKTIIYHVLKNFELVPVKETIIPLVIEKNQVNLTAKGGVQLGLKKLG